MHDRVFGVNKRKITELLEATAANTMADSSSDAIPETRTQLQVLPVLVGEIIHIYI